MKKMFFSSLFAMLLLVVCQNEMAYAQKKATEAKTDEVTVHEFQKMKTPPTYPGGIAKFYTAVFKAVKYPEAAAKDHKQGTVVVSFVIEKDGSMANFSVDKKLGYGTDEAAILALKSAKKWKPGLVDGKAVRVKMNVPVKFSLAS